MLLRIPRARPLFHRAVMQSAANGLLDRGFPPLEEKEQEVEVGLREIFGRPMRPADLRTIAAEDFVTRMVGDQMLYDALDAVTGGHIVDRALVTADSWDLLRPGALDGIDLLIGGNSDERTSTRGIPDATLSEQEFAAFMTANYADGWQQAYRPSDPRHAYRLRLRADAVNLLQKALVSAEYAIRHNDDINAWVYYFNHAPPGRNAEFYGSYHSSDLWYFMNSLREWPGQRPWTEADYRMADIMSTYLANFVKTGNPNGPGLPAWRQPADGPELMRFADGYAYPVQTTPYPCRDALNRAEVLREYQVDPAAVAGPVEACPGQ